MTQFLHLHKGMFDEMESEVKKETILYVYRCTGILFPISRLKFLMARVIFSYLYWKMNPELIAFENIV